MALYMGTCRYMGLKQWKDFVPSRFHTTKEILHYLEHFRDIKTYLNSFPYQKQSVIFGDCNHPAVIDKHTAFIEKSKTENFDTLVLEICSKKVIYETDQNIPLNAFYCSRDNKHYKEPYTLTENEISEDIDKILSISKKLFNNHNFKIMIITHLDLKSKKTNTLLKERTDLCSILESICKEKGILCCNIKNALIDKKGLVDKTLFIEDVSKDTRHFSDAQKKEMIFSYIAEQFNKL